MVKDLVHAGFLLPNSDDGSRVYAGIVRHSRLSNCPLTFFRQRVEITTACVQHPCTGQFIDGVEHAPSFGWFVPAASNNTWRSVDLSPISRNNRRTRKESGFIVDLAGLL